MYLLYICEVIRTAPPLQLETLHHKANLVGCSGAGSKQHVCCRTNWGSSWAFLVGLTFHILFRESGLELSSPSNKDGGPSQSRHPDMWLLPILNLFLVNLINAPEKNQLGRKGYFILAHGSRSIRSTMEGEDMVAIRDDTAGTGSLLVTSHLCSGRRGWVRRGAGL